MAYTEGPPARRYWRVRYQLADGTWTSASTDANGDRFADQETALQWGRDQEALSRHGHHKPRQADDELTLGQWITQWWGSLDVVERSEDTYRWRIERLILPHFGQRTLTSLTVPEIAAWERRLQRADGFAARSAKAARTLLITILGDAVPQHIPANPAVRPPRRGRKTGRQAEAPTIREHLTPLELVLFAERCALLMGNVQAFIVPILIGYTGCRWGEAVGMERRDIDGDVWHLRWQLYHKAKRWNRTPPKDDSIRDVDLPPFLTDLIGVQLREGRPACRRCPPTVHAPGAHVFGGPRRADGGHMFESTFRQRTWEPAMSGWYPKEPRRKQPRTARPVLVTGWTHNLRKPDATGPAFPGVPLHRPWPAADTASATFTPPTGTGYLAAPIDTPVASWLPIHAGVVRHGLRHGHTVALDELHTPRSLKKNRLWGTPIEGIEGVYSNPSDPMRVELKAGLQARWETSLAARARIHPTSPLPLLDELLKPFRASGESEARLAG